ncbi:hypothetical protein Tco_1037831 [Tanacetum coccineum]
MKFLTVHLSAKELWNICAQYGTVQDLTSRRSFPNRNDPRLKKGEGLPDDLPNREKTFHDIGVIDRKISVDMTQKAMVKWAIEGDENSKFFNGIVNKKRRQFSARDWSRVPVKGIFPRRLGADSSHDLEGDISVDAIKKAD